MGISGIETSKNFVILNLHLLSSSHLNLSLIVSLNWVVFTYTFSSIFMSTNVKATPASTIWQPALI